MGFLTFLTICIVGLNADATVFVPKRDKHDEHDERDERDGYVKFNGHWYPTGDDEQDLPKRLTGPIEGCVSDQDHVECVSTHVQHLIFDQQHIINSWGPESRTVEGHVEYIMDQVSQDNTEYEALGILNLDFDVIEAYVHEHIASFMKK
jgi:hypothetical protein